MSNTHTCSLYINAFPPLCDEKLEYILISAAVHYYLEIFSPGSSEDHLAPMLVSGLRGYHVIDVACGSGDAHSLAVADDGKYSVLVICLFCSTHSAMDPCKLLTL